MIRVVPIPRNASIIVILKHPSQTLDIRLHNLLLKFLELSFASDVEFLGIVAVFPAIFTVFNSVLISIYFGLIFFFHLFFYDIFDYFLGSVEFFLFREVSLCQ